MARNDGAILVSGASGYLGGHIAATLLTETEAPLVLPIRARHGRDAVVAAIAAELEAQGRAPAPATLERLLTVDLPPPGQVNDLLPRLRSHGVTEIVHAAGCLSYFNEAKLRAGNVELTRELLDLGARLEVSRFTYVSTAFSSGYVDGPIPESLHPDPERDPNAYTRSKRETERLVAGSGLPWIIVRPAIVVGDSHDGRYGGKPYGVYQIWSGLARFFTDRPRRRIHAIAAEVPLNTIHQDAFQAGFREVHRHAVPGEIIHLSARLATSPTVRDYWELFMRECARPHEVRYFSDLREVPLAELDDGERLMVEVTQSNIEISSRSWDFQTGWLDRRDRKRMGFVEISRDSLAVVHRRFLATCPAAQAYLERHR